MKLSQELRQKIAAKNKALGEILATSAKEARHYTDEESQQVDALQADIDSLLKQAKDAEYFEERAAQSAAAQNDAANAEKVATIAGGNPASQSEQRAQEKLAGQFRLTRALRSQITKKALTGAEAEVHAEAEKEARQFSRAVEGFAIPSWAMGEKRAATVGTAANAGDTVGTRLEGFIESLRPMPKIVEMGAVNLDGLTSNVEMMRQTGNTVASWKGEFASADDTNTAHEKLSLVPNRLTAKTTASRQLMIQSSVPVSFENLLRLDLRKSHELALDLAAINGSGTAPEPEGILNTTGIGSVAIGVNGGAITRAKIIALIRQLGVANVDIDDLSFLGNPQVMAELMNTSMDSGSGRFLMENAGSGLMGYNAEFTTQVPSDLDKGSETGTLSALLFGNFSQVILATWGGMDIIIDPYTSGGDGMVNVYTHGFHDVGVRQPAAFAAIKDINTTATA